MFFSIIIKFMSNTDKLQSKQIYYHFLPYEYAVNSMEERKIKVSLVDQLNDPFELLPNIRFEGRSIRKPYHDIRRSISKRYGLLCFSKTWSEPLLWGHYADKHHGVALGFEVSKEPISVTYSSDGKRPHIDLSNDNSGNDKQFLDLARVKHKTWEYEQEHRLIVELSDCEKTAGNYYLPFESLLNIKEVILGAKSDYKKDLDRLKKLGKGCGAKIIPTRLSWSEYRVQMDGTKIKHFS